VTKARSILAGFAAGVALAVAIGYVAVHLPAVRAEQAKTEQARADLAKRSLVTTPAKTDGVLRCEGVAAGMVVSYNGLRDYLVEQERRAAANGHMAGFVEWGENERGRVTELRSVPLDRVIPDRPDLYDAALQACVDNPERFEVPKATDPAAAES
jgi:hypothetical protein